MFAPAALRSVWEHVPMCDRSELEKGGTVTPVPPGTMGKGYASARELFAPRRWAPPRTSGPAAARPGQARVRSTLGRAAVNRRPPTLGDRVTCYENRPRQAPSDSRLRWFAGREHVFEPETQHAENASGCQVPNPSAEESVHRRLADSRPLGQLGNEHGLSGRLESHHRRVAGRELHP